MLELVVVPSGQCRTQKTTPEMTAQLIRYSAIRPNERFKFLQESDSIVNVFREDKITQAFGKL